MIHLCLTAMSLTLLPPFQEWHENPSHLQNRWLQVFSYWAIYLASRRSIEYSSSLVRRKVLFSGSSKADAAYPVMIQMKFEGMVTCIVSRHLNQFSCERESIQSVVLTCSFHALACARIEQQVLDLQQEPRNTAQQKPTGYELVPQITQERWLTSRDCYHQFRKKSVIWNSAGSICLITDASDSQWEVILTQVSCENLQLKTGQQRHEPQLVFQRIATVIKKDAFPTVEATDKLRCFLMREKPFTIFTNHKNLVYAFYADAWESDFNKQIVHNHWHLSAKFQRVWYFIEHVPSWSDIRADELSKWKVETSRCILPILSVWSLIRRALNGQHCRK